MKTFPINAWKEAHAYATQLTQLLKRDVGILKTKEYNKLVYQVIHLPKPENRYGFELRCEIVPYYETRMETNESDR